MATRPLARIKTAFSRVLTPMAAPDGRAPANDRPRDEDDFASMPFDTTHYWAPPLIYDEWEGVNVAFRTSPDLVRRLLPAPLMPDATPWGSKEGDVVVITQCNYQLVKPRPIEYHATCLMVPATLNGKRGFYEARLYENGRDSTLLIIWGREVWGFPKLSGNTQATLDGDRVKSELRTLDATTIDIELALSGDEANESPATLPLFCRKTIPSPEDLRIPDVDRLVEIPWHQSAGTRRSGGVEQCSVHLEMGRGVVEFPVREVAHAYWSSHSPGTRLDEGKVVYDYLQ